MCICLQILLPGLHTYAQKETQIVQYSTQMLAGSEVQPTGAFKCARENIVFGAKQHRLEALAQPPAPPLAS